MAHKKDLLVLTLALVCAAVCLAGKAAASKYLIVTPQVYRTGSDEVISVTLFNLAKRTVIQTLLMKGSERIIHKSATFHPEDSGSVKEILIKIPDNAKTGYDWKLTVTGSGGLNFKESKHITVERRGLEVFIQTDKPVYKPGEKVRFRVVAVTPDLRPAKGKVSDIAIVNPTGSRIVQWKDKELDEGFLSLDLTLSKKPVLGQWKITAKYQGVSKEVNIKVDKYVLPKFEVTIENPNYLHYGKKKFSARICAKYTYGKKVEGKLNVTFCYKFKSIYRWQRKKYFPCVNINKKIDGCADLDVDFESKPFSVSSSWNTIVAVHAAVTELATGTTLNGTKNVTLIRQEIKLSLAETPDFKPGFPFAGRIFIQTYDGKPALNKKIKFTAKSSDSKRKSTTLLDFERVIENGVFEFDLASGVPSDAKYIDIEAVHVLKGSYYRSWNKKVRVFRRIKSWYSPSKTYMKIEKPAAPLLVGSFEVIQVKFNPNMMKDNRIFYKLLCRGNIEDSGSVSDSRFGGKIAKAAISIFVTQKMAPKCRLLAFFVRTDGEFVGDSEEIPIEKKFENEVTVSFSESQTKPGRNVSISLQAAPGSRFALSAVDKSVELLGVTNDIKASRIMNMIERLDVTRRGDTSSCKGGRRPLNLWRRRRSSPVGRWWGSWWESSDHVDGVKAFNDVGLVYFSNLDINVKPCIRRQRPYYRNYHFGDDFAFDMPMASSSGSGGAPGPKVKLSSKQNESRPRPRPKQKKVKKPAKKAKDVNVVVRSEFPETWIWTEDTIDMKTGKKTIEAKVPDTLTTWYANAFAMSSTHGIGVASPTPFLVFQPFFVSLTLPYSMIKGETVLVPATVFNYLGSCLTVRLTLEASKDFNADTSSTKLCVCGGKSNTFKFKITPKKIGKIPILVQAITTGDNVCAKNKKMANSVGAADAVKRMLLVEPEGIKKEYNYNSLFCPNKDGSGVYTESFQLKLPSPIVPGSTFARISVYGDLMGPTLTDLDKLLAMPYGCGEQNMLKFAPNIYVLQYLTSTNQLTKDAEERAKKYMVSGYQRELTYKRSDGSYSAFGNRDREGSTWLTAFVLKSYAQAKPYIFIDDKEIQQSMKFLLSLQKPDGCFREVGMVHHKAMKGGVSSGISMTAFVLTALVEAGLKIDSPKAMAALGCISKGLSTVSDSYSAALLAYTLTLTGSQDRSFIIAKLKSLAINQEGMVHWSSGRTSKSYYEPPPADVEMTSYSLMAYISGSNKDTLSAAPIIRWLSKQRNSLGGFASTQDTCVALQALALYGGLVYESGTKLSVHVKTPQVDHTFNIHDGNKLVLQRVEIPEVPTKVKITATGKGCALLQANVKYNIPVVKEVPTFFLDLRLKQTGSNCRHEMKVCASYSGKGASNMALIDVKMVSGFEPVVDHLDKILQSTSNDLLKDYEFEENKLTLYFEKIEAKTCLTFPVEQTTVVLDRKKAHAKVYDYYNTAEFATTMYSIDTCKEVN